MDIKKNSSRKTLEDLKSFLESTELQNSMKLNKQKEGFRMRAKIAGHKGYVDTITVKENNKQKVYITDIYTEKSDNIDEAYTFGDGEYDDEVYEKTPSKYKHKSKK